MSFFITSSDIFAATAKASPSTSRKPLPPLPLDRGVIPPPPPLPPLPPPPLPLPTPPLPLPKLLRRREWRHSASSFVLGVSFSPRVGPPAVPEVVKRGIDVPAAVARLISEWARRAASPCQAGTEKNRTSEKRKQHPHKKERVYCCTACDNGVLFTLSAT